MKSLFFIKIVFFCLFLPMAYANQSLKLKALKPIRSSDLRIGNLTATLEDSSTGKQLRIIAGELGDCKSCIRGVVVAPFEGVGFRLEGKSLSTLEVRSKESSNVKYTKCDQTALDISNVYSCEFLKNSQQLKLTIRVTI